MTSHPHNVPADDPDLERYERAHAIDHDMVSTNLAISIYRAARDVGHPADSDAARKAMTGPAAAAAVQATMDSYLDGALPEDEAAEQYSTQALRCGLDAVEVAESRRRLPEEHVTLSDGSSQTRGQVQAGLEQRMEAGAQREARGDFDHRDEPPGLGTRLAVSVVLSLIEVFLLIWPVTNASWNDPKSVAYVAGLVTVFLIMNDWLSRYAGMAVRSYRETREAARELTVIAITVGRAGQVGAGREIAGHVDSRRVQGQKRKAVAFCGLFATVLSVYAAVMFTRVLRLAAPLGSPTFAVLAAALITAFTASAPILMAIRWSHGNGLGDQLREYGAITADSRSRAERLHEESTVAARTSSHFDEQARLALERANQVLADGYGVVAVGLQKTARMLGLDTVLTPDPTNLFVAKRPIRDRATHNLGRARTMRAEAQTILAEQSPFHPTQPAPNPWHTRTAPRRALPDLEHVDPPQHGPLHQASSRTPWSRRTLVMTVAIVLAVIILVIALIL